MSYCRFSCNDWASEVYVYGAMEGVVIHVAGNKPVGDIPKADGLLDAEPFDAGAWVAAHNAQMNFLKTAKRRDITLLHAGETFEGLSPQQAIDKLMELRAIGFHVPEHALVRLREEVAEEQGELAS